MIKILAPNGKTKEFENGAEPLTAKELCKLFDVSGGWFEVDFGDQISHNFVIDGRRYAVISKTISGIWPNGSSPNNGMFEEFEQIPHLKKEEVERRLKLTSFI